MSSVYVTQRSALAKFNGISPKLFQIIIHYFERNRYLFSSLDKPVYFEVKVKYLNALFNQGAYEKIVEEIDEAIEICIQENIYDLGTYKNIYAQLLFKKAVALFHTNQLPQALRVLKALIRLNGQRDAYLYLVRRCCQQSYKPIIMKSRAIFIGLLLLTAAVLAIEIFLIKNFFPTYEPEIQLSRNILFATSLIVLLLPELGCRWAAYLKAKQIERSIR